MTTLKVPSENLLIENAKLQWRNFSGEERQFNNKGNRNFCIMLDGVEYAEELEALGWPIKYAKPVEEGGPLRPFIKVNMKYTPRSQPKLHLINSRGIKKLDEDSAFALDFVDIAKVDLEIRAFRWEFGGKEGVKAMLNSIYVTIRESFLERKYADVPEIDANGNLLAIESAVPNDPWATPGDDDILEEAPLELERGF
jgi:hypothetical protein